MKIESQHLFAIFPYLKTSTPVFYKNLTLRNCSDTNGLSNEAIHHLKVLRSMFMLRHNVRIQNVTYAYLFPAGEQAQTTQFIQSLLEFQAITCFIYSSPHPTFGDPFLTYEHSSFFLLTPERFTKHLVLHEDANLELLTNIEDYEIDKLGQIAGYTALLNNKIRFWVTNKDQIFPPIPDMWLNVSQDLGQEYSHVRFSHRIRPIVEYFSRNTSDSSLQQRILTAIGWYNRTLQMGSNEDVTLVNLAIAFESLLNLKQGEKVVERFKEAISLLVGGLPRLDSWLTQFYKARSEIVHEGKSQNFMFVATDTPKKPSDDLNYRSLVSYGRIVFQICVATILTGSQMVQQSRLASMLVTNQQRFEWICQHLNNADANETASERLEEVATYIYDIEKYIFVSESPINIKLLIGAIKLVSRNYLEVASNVDIVLVSKMKKLTLVKASEVFEALDLIKEIKEDFDKLDSIHSTVSTNHLATISSLVKSVWHYTFFHYFQLRKNL